MNEVESLACIVGALLVLALWAIWCPRSPRDSRLDGWWHYVLSGRYTDSAWARAAEQSINNSRTRRGREAK